MRYHERPGHGIANFVNDVVILAKPFVAIDAPVAAPELPPLRWACCCCQLQIVHSETSHRPFIVDRLA